MAVTSSDRLGLTLWSSGLDPFTRAQRQADNVALNNLAAIDRQGVASGRPAATVRGTYYYATDTGVLSRATGSDWVTVATLATGGGLEVKGDGAFLEVTDGSGDQAFSVNADGKLKAGRATLPTGAGDVIAEGGFVTFRNPVAADRTLYLEAAEDATGSLIRAEVDGTRRFEVDAKGRIYLSSLSDNTVPGTPGGAGVIYCNNSGDLYFKSSSGTVRLLAAH